MHRRHRILSLATFLLVTTSVLAQEGEFTISGKVEGLESKPIRFSYKDKTGKLVMDSAMVKDGQFTYSRTIDKMTLLSFYPANESVMKRVDRGYFPAKSSQFQCIAFAGARIKFSGRITDFVDAYPAGDKTNNELAKLNKAVYPLMNESVNLEVKLAKQLIKDSVDRKAAEARVEQLDAEVVSLKKEFIQKNPASYVSAWVLGDMMLRTQIDNQEAVRLYEGLDHQKLNTNNFFIDVVKRVEGLSATAVGKQVPDISSLHTYTGEKFTLNALQGKYVVLDFWGTWCGPCISGMPSMKKYADKYAGKLELVGIAQESDDGTQWRKFLDKNKDYQWHQVLSRPDDDLILRFSVAGFPTKIIVDPQGKIVARYVGEDEAIYKKLDELLNP